MRKENFAYAKRVKNPVARAGVHAVNFIAGSYPGQKALEACALPAIDWANSAVEYTGLEESIHTLSEVMDKKENTLPIFLFNHGSLGDFAALREALNKVNSLEPRIKKTYLPIATSLGRGGQGRLSEVLYKKAIMPEFQRLKLEPLAVMNKNDQERGGVRELLHYRKFIHSIKEEGSAIALFIEGTMEGGRKDSNGKPKGLQQVSNSNLLKIFENAQSAKKTPVIIPIGISRIFELHNPDSRLPTPQLVNAMMLNAIRKPLGKELVKKAHVASGTPFEINHLNVRRLKEDERKRISQDLNDFSMMHLAHLIDEDLRGNFPLSVEIPLQIGKESEIPLLEKRIR